MCSIILYLTGLVVIPIYWLLHSAQVIQYTTFLLLPLQPSVILVYILSPVLLQIKYGLLEISPQILQCDPHTEATLLLPKFSNTKTLLTLHLKNLLIR